MSTVADDTDVSGKSLPTNEDFEAEVERRLQERLSRQQNSFSFDRYGSNQCGDNRYSHLWRQHEKDIRNIPPVHYKGAHFPDFMKNHYRNGPGRGWSVDYSNTRTEEIPPPVIFPQVRHDVGQQADEEVEPQSEKKKKMK